MNSTKQKIHWLSGKLVIVSVMLLWPVMVFALQPCGDSAADICQNPSHQSDCDQDGFTDEEECIGFNTAGGEFIGPTALNPKEPDLFYLVTHDNGDDLTETHPLTGVPSILFQALTSDSNALNFYKDGLKVNTHRISKSYCGGDRLLIDRGNGTYVRAAKILEELDTDQGGDDIGGTPTGKITSDPFTVSTIYTKKIANNVNNVNCNGALCSIKNTKPLITNEGGNNDPIIHYLIRQVVAHEIAHGSALAATDEKSYYHYRRSGTIMDPAASFRRGVYVISTSFEPTKDPPALTLQ